MTELQLSNLRDARYGARGRIALIVPNDNAVIEPELAPVLPDGVTGNVFRLPHAPHDTMVTDALALAHATGRLGASSLLYCCVSSVVLQGVTEDNTFCRDLSAAAGVPASTATTSMVDALRALGARRLAVLFPYVEERCLGVRRYLAEHGLEVVADRRLGLIDEQINNLSPREVYEAAGQVPTTGADVLMLVATNMPTLEVLTRLQERYEIPVISTNAALAWAGLRLLGLAEDSIPGGRILDAIRQA